MIKRFHSINNSSKFSLGFLLLFALHFSSEAQVEEIRTKLLNSNELLIAAHRAAHKNHPENSLEAIQEAIDLGVDIVELDVRVSTDGEIFLMHDQTIDRTTTGSGDIENLSSADLKRFKLLFDGENSGISIPTLKEALAITKGKILVDLDLKTDKIEAIVAIVLEMQVEDEVIFFDSDWKVLKEVKAIFPEAYLMPRAYKPKHVKKAYRKLDPVMVHIDPSFNTEKTMTSATKYGLRTWINSLGDLDRKLVSNPNPEFALELIKYGANTVQTDLPEFWIGIKMDSTSINP